MDTPASSCYPVVLHSYPKQSCGCSGGSQCVGASGHTASLATDSLATASLATACLATACLATAINLKTHHFRLYTVHKPSKKGWFFQLTKPTSAHYVLSGQVASMPGGKEA